jgi:hypothetical protein
MARVKGLEPSTSSVTGRRGLLACQRAQRAESTVLAGILAASHCSQTFAFPRIPSHYSSVVDPSVVVMCAVTTEVMEGHPHPTRGWKA